MANRNITPNRTATVEQAKVEMSLFMQIVRAASKQSGISETKLLLSDDFVNKAFALVENKLKTA